MTAPVELKEYDTVEVAMSAAVAGDLQRLGAGRLAVGVGTSPGHYTVTASQWVGVLVTPELDVVVKPKVSLENLFTLLGVGLPPHAWQRESFAFSPSRDLLVAISQFYARAVHQAIGAGVLRSYRVHEERLVAMRGRIDMAEQIRLPAQRSTIACTFDEYTADVMENRVLKAAAALLLRVPGVPHDARRSLKQAMVAFEEVADGWVHPDTVDRVHFTRLNAHYEPAMRLAQLILRNLSLIDRVGHNDASAFLVDMNDLFQRFVTARLRTFLRGRLVVDAEPTTWLGKGRQVAMAPDLVFRRAKAAVFVGDTKYKLSPDGRGRSSDYYQMLAYVTALGLPAGVLIYCQESGAAPQREVVVHNHGARLMTYALPMSGNSAALEAELRTLADWIAAEASGGLQ